MYELICFDVFVSENYLDCYQHVVLINFFGMVTNVN